MLSGVSGFSETMSSNSPAWDLVLPASLRCASSGGKGTWTWLCVGSQSRFLILQLGMDGHDDLTNKNPGHGTQASQRSQVPSPAWSLSAPAQDSLLAQVAWKGRASPGYESHSCHNSFTFRPSYSADTMWPQSGDSSPFALSPVKGCRGLCRALLYLPNRDLRGRHSRNDLGYGLFLRHQ